MLFYNIENKVVLPEFLHSISLKRIILLQTLKKKFISAKTKVYGIDSSGIIKNEEENQFLVERKFVELEIMKMIF